MTEKYYDYDHIDNIINEAVKVVKLGVELDITNIRYEKLSDTLSYNCYEVCILHRLDYYLIGISIIAHKKYDYYNVSKRDYSVKYEYSADLSKVK